jgi:hypothetical protein
MREHLSRLLLIFVLLPLCTPTFSQQDSSVFSKVLSLPDKVFGKVDKQSQQLTQKLTSQTEKYLSRLERQEQKLKKKLSRIDSVKAKEVFGDVEERYTNLRNQLNNNASQQFSTVYSGHADSLTTALSFLNANPLMQQAKGIGSNLKNITALQNKFNQTENIRKQIKARQDALKQQLQNTPVAKELAKYKKQVYYYQAQVKEYREALNDPKLLGAKLVDAAKKIPLFDQFFKKHSELARLFPMPQGFSPAAQGAPIPGLQTQVQVIQNIQTQFGTSGPNPMQAVQQQMGAVQNEMTKLKNKFSQFGSGSSDDEMPDFKPNTQKTKSFLQRLEFGSNFQTTSSRTYFPVTTDMGLSVGYKLNNKSIIGVGSSYKLGLGNSINNIRLTHQGIGFRSFLDWKLKGSFWISGGYEQNYLATFRRLQELNNRAVWKQSALIGMSKVVDMKSKFFKKTKVQLLYDFLWKQQLPQTQAVLFRVGYNF